jgi:hypothetical protein
MEPLTTPGEISPIPSAAATVGAMPVGVAGILELLRGLGTTGVVAGALYWGLTQQITEARDEVAALVETIDALEEEVGALRVQVAILQTRAGLDAVKTPGSSER